MSTNLLNKLLHTVSEFVLGLQPLLYDFAVIIENACVGIVVEDAAAVEDISA